MSREILAMYEWGSESWQLTAVNEGPNAPFFEFLHTAPGCVSELIVIRRDDAVIFARASALAARHAKEAQDALRGK